MKKLCGLVILLSLVMPLCFADFLVLKNGKRFEVPDGYEVKGQFVLFKTRGQLTQLPLKLVDLEKSKELTAQMEEKRRKEAKAAAEAEEAARKRRFSQQKNSMADVAEFVEQNRGEDNPRPASVSIDDTGVESYAEKNPMEKKPREESSGLSAGSTKYHEDRDNFANEFQRLKKELDDIDRRIKDLTDRKNNLNSMSAIGDQAYGNEDVHDPRAKIEADEGNNPAFDEMERAEKEIKDLQAKKKDVQDKLNRLDKQAKQRDIRDYQRHQPKKKKEN